MQNKSRRVRVVWAVTLTNSYKSRPGWGVCERLTIRSCQSRSRGELRIEVIYSFELIWTEGTLAKGQEWEVLEISIQCVCIRGS